MSHFTTIETQIRDMRALNDACAELGLELIQNAEARGFASNRRHGDYVIKLKGPYDIALTRQPGGTFSLVTDWWGGHVEKEVGGQYGRLLQLYGVHKATLEARKKGLTVRRQAADQGRIKLTIGGV